MMLQSPIKSSRYQWLLIGAAVVAYALAVAGGAMPTLSATLVSALALAALGAALFALVAAWVGPVANARLSGRAGAARRRYRTMSLLALGLVYVTLVAGVVVTNQDSMWDCLALPVCLNPSELSSVVMWHRVLAGVAALLVAELALRTRRTSSIPALRRAATWTLGLMIAQVLIGLGQVVLARGGDTTPVMAVRAGHLAIGMAAWGALVIQTALALRLPFGEPKAEASPPVAAKTDAAAVVKQPSLLKDYVSLTKPGVITLLIFTTVISMYITPAGIPSLWLVFWTFVGGWLMAAGAHSVNCWADQDIDINMGRTSRRPIPSGRIPAWHALVLGIALGVIAFAILVVFVNLPAALLSLAGYLYYVLIYTRWLKRSTPSNIVIGGGAGAFPPLVGWAAATGGLTLPSLFLFAIIFYWTPPHFWALALIREKDYARASVPMLPVVAGAGETKRQILLYTVLMFVLTILPTPLHMFGLAYMVMAIGLGALFFSYVYRLLREGTPGAALGLYKFSLLYLALLFTAMLIDRLVFV